MNASFLLAYLLVSGTILASGYIAYKLLLSRMKMHAFNRCMIIAIYLLSAITPCSLIFSRSTAENTPTEMTANRAIILQKCGNPVGMIGKSGVYSEAECLSEAPSSRSAHKKPRSINIETIIIYALFAGAAMVTLQLLAAIAWIFTLFSRGESYRLGHVRLILLRDSKIAPFSWLNLIFISRKDYYTDGDMIVEHELNHIRRIHFADLALAELFCIVMWWNPASWLLKRELNSVHEFQADSDVVASGFAVNEYQMLLVRKAAGARMPLVGSSLNSCKLKKRFVMMRKHDASKTSRLKAVAIYPLMTIAIVGTGMTEAGDILRSAAAKDIPFLETRRSLPYAGKPFNDKKQASQEEAEKKIEPHSKRDVKPKKAEQAPIGNYIIKSVDDSDGYSDEIQWAEIIETTETDATSGYEDHSTYHTGHKSGAKLAIVTNYSVTETNSGGSEVYSDRTQWAEVISEEIADSEVCYEVTGTIANQHDGAVKTGRHNVVKIRKNNRPHN